MDFWTGPISWTPGLSVGVESIDAEHRILVEIMGDVAEVLGTGAAPGAADRALRRLFAYVDWHFGHEEALMAEHGYPGFAQHKGRHDLFVARLRELDNQLATGQVPVGELADFLIVWLTDHIMGDDRRLGRFLAGRLPDQGAPDATRAAGTRD